MGLTVEELVPGPVKAASAVLAFGSLSLFSLVTARVLAVATPLPSHAEGEFSVICGLLEDGSSKRLCWPRGAEAREGRGGGAEGRRGGGAEGQSNGEREREVGLGNHDDACTWMLFLTGYALVIDFTVKASMLK